MRIKHTIVQRREWLTSFALSVVLHILILFGAILFPANYFDQPRREDVPWKKHVGDVREQGTPADDGPASSSGTSQLFGSRLESRPASLFQLIPEDGESGESNVFAASSLRPPRLLTSRPRPARLLSPDYAANTIPTRPEKSMWQEVASRGEEFLAGDVFREGIALQGDPAEIFQQEARFVEQLRRDLEDGWLDMDFAAFLIPAEYYRLYRALAAQGQQPAFTLDDALARFQTRLARVGADLPSELDALSLVMILQRYAENKYYPENGSGMLLDSLFHNLADCEGGSREIIAYLDALYPGLSLGTNRGMIPTTDGRLIGHMQVYLSPDQRTRQIIDSPNGLVIEATRVDRESILPWKSGDRYPLEDFVYRFYPQLKAGTTASHSPAAADGDGVKKRPVVGASNHPLKMRYDLPSSVIGDRPLDLEELRRQKIVNGFQTSHLPSCDPGVDPERVDRTNLFSNLVTVDPKLRKSLIRHYLAGLDYWDNQVMPSWHRPDFLAGYHDLAATLLSDSTGEIVLDDGEIVAPASVRGHGLLLRFLRAQRKSSMGKDTVDDGRVCSQPVPLDGRLRNYLFTGTDQQGLFLLHEPALVWEDFLQSVLDDCLAAPEDPVERAAWNALFLQAEVQASFRKLLSLRVERLGHGTSALRDAHIEAIRSLLTGTTMPTADGTGETPAIVLGNRRSQARSPTEPSVQESVQEWGRTGLHFGLLQDLVDFLPADEWHKLLYDYVGRQDLRLGLRRAAGLVDFLAELGGSQEKPVHHFFQELAPNISNPELRLAFDTAVSRLSGGGNELISMRIVNYLRSLERVDAKTLLVLQGYGLNQKDGRHIIRQWIQRDLNKLARQELQGRGAVKLYGELLELIKGFKIFDDVLGRAELRHRLMAELVDRFERLRALSFAVDASPPDYSPLLGRFFLLRHLLAKTESEETETEKETERIGQQEFLGSFSRFAVDVSFGRILVDLVVDTVERNSLIRFMDGWEERQRAILRKMRESGDISSQRLAALLGESNVLYRFQQISAPHQQQGVGGEQYLLNLHRQVAELLTTNTQEAGQGPEAFPLAFYRDKGVRESFSLLGSLASGSGEQRGVKFRTIKNINEIKDMSRIRVIEDSRKITRQDMSLLTLALNPANNPVEIGRSWQETVEVIAGHRKLAAENNSLKRYLFAPHVPYLLENDYGFFYTPALIADLNNAAEWGGKNDILLSSYLHFRNMVSELPPWLLEAATRRSHFERQIMQKFRTRTFLPMILECTADAEIMPDPLFRAKWTIRKPFGEDIIPATLLLLRLGYMDFDPDGELVLTEKYQQR